MSTGPTLNTANSLEMYKTMHDERVSLGEETRRLEVLVVAAVAALYAWLATNHVHGAPWFIGSALAALASCRAAVIGERILIIKEYLKALESQIFPHNTTVSGYEHFNADRTRNKWYKHLRTTSAIIWTCLFFATLLAPRYLDK